MSIVRDFEKAFNRQDVDALLACFTADGSYVDTFFGAHTGQAALRGMFERMQAAFMAAGADAVTAMQRAEAAMFGMVQRQATMVAFVSIFQLLAVVFVAMVPLVLLMKRPRSRARVEAAH